MKKFNYCLLFSLTVFISGCVNSNMNVFDRPEDYFLDYWIKEEINIRVFDESRVYETGDNRVRYLDSHYEFDYNEVGEKTNPLIYSYYIMFKKENNYIVSAICISDPNISIYGLTMASSQDEVRDTFLDLGCTYLDHYSGVYPCYAMDDVEYRVYSWFIQVTYII